MPYAICFKGWLESKAFFQCKSFSEWRPQNNSDRFEMSTSAFMKKTLLVFGIVLTVKSGFTDATFDRKTRPLNLQNFTWKCVKGGRCVRNGKSLFDITRKGSLLRPQLDYIITYVCWFYQLLPVLGLTLVI